MNFQHLVWIFTKCERVLWANNFFFHLFIEYEREGDICFICISVKNEVGMIPYHHSGCTSFSSYLRQSSSFQ